MGKIPSKDFGYLELDGEEFYEGSSTLCRLDSKDLIDSAKEFSLSLHILRRIPGHEDHSNLHEQNRIDSLGIHENFEDNYLNLPKSFDEVHDEV